MTAGSESPLLAAARVALVFLDDMCLSHDDCWRRDELRDAIAAHEQGSGEAIIRKWTDEDGCQHEEMTIFPRSPLSAEDEELCETLDIESEHHVGRGVRGPNPQGFISVQLLLRATSRRIRELSTALKNGKDNFNALKFQNEALSAKVAALSAEIERRK